MEVNDSLWRILRGLHEAARVQRQVSAGSPFGPAALGLLNVAAQGPVRPSAAAAELGVPAPSITRAVRELTEAGLARQVGSRADGRSYIVELTDAGRAAREEFRARLTARLASHLAGWTSDEIVTFADHLERLVGALTDDLPAHADRAPTRNRWRADT